MPLFDAFHPKVVLAFDILSLTAGLLKPSSGEILLDGENKIDRTKIGYMFQKDRQKLKVNMDEEEIKRALLKKAVGFESDEVVEEYTTDENGNAMECKP